LQLKIAFEDTHVDHWKQGASLWCKISFFFKLIGIRKIF